MRPSTSSAIEPGQSPRDQRDRLARAVRARPRRRSRPRPCRGRSPAWRPCARPHDRRRPLRRSSSISPRAEARRLVLARLLERERRHGGERGQVQQLARVPGQASTRSGSISTVPISSPPDVTGTVRSALGRHSRRRGTWPAGRVTATPRPGSTIATGRPTLAAAMLADSFDAGAGERGVHHLLVDAAQPRGRHSGRRLRARAGSGSAPKESPRRGTPPTPRA